MSEIEPGIRTIIEERIAKIEKDENVDIILAVESGSRAWGFDSLDSDYDVRFIYKHELKWYLNILPKKDVIELPVIGLDDYSGWDIRKALWLMNKSNPVLFEWIRSPIVYLKKERDFELLKKASEKYFSSISSIYHYLHMAKGNYREYLQGDIVKAKKYFYVLRPILACVWIKKNNESPPIEFDILLENINDNDLKKEIDYLLKRKRAGIELGEEKAIPIINEYINDQISELENYTGSYNHKDKPSSEYLDNVFWEILN